jgi:hypothetical protein
MLLEVFDERAEPLRLIDERVGRNVRRGRVVLNRIVIIA